MTNTDLRNPNETTEATITRLVFEGARPSELRGLSDVFDVDQIRAIADNPRAGQWRDRAVDYLDTLD